MSLRLSVSGQVWMKSCCHYRRYTKTTLRRLVEQEGFAIEQVRYADCLGFIAALVFRLLQQKCVDADGYHN